MQLDRLSEQGQKGIGQRDRCNGRGLGVSGCRIKKYAVSDQKTKGILNQKLGRGVKDSERNETRTLTQYTG